MSSKKGTKRKAGEAEVERPRSPDPKPGDQAVPGPSASARKRHKRAATAKALKLSTIPTPMLVAWAADFEEFKDSGLGVAEKDRDDLIAWISKAARPAPTYKEALAYWRTIDAHSAALPELAPSAPKPAAGDASAAPAAAASSASAAAAATTAATLLATTKQALQRALDFGFELEDEDALLPGQCTHCFMVTSGMTTNKFPCAHCGFISGKPEDSVANLAIRAKNVAAIQTAAAAAASSGKDDTTTASVLPSAPKLSTVDKELTRLTEEGDPFPRFDDKAPISAETALQEIRLSWCGKFFAHPSAALIKYIQSGKFKEPGFAVPRSAIDAEVARTKDAQGHQLRLNLTDGSFTTGATLTYPTVTDARKLIDMFLSTVGPALFDRPRALLDWFMLLRTVLTLDAAGPERGGGWAIASQYLSAVLADNVPMRQPFGEYQQRILDHVAFRPVAAPAGVGSSFGSSSSASRSASALAPRVYDDAKESACRNWNRGLCTEPCMLTPKRDHGCMWKACHDTKVHRGIDCAHAPPGFTAAPNSAGAGAPRPRGARGGAGRSAPARAGPGAHRG